MKTPQERVKETKENFTWEDLSEEKYRYKDGIAYERCGCWEQMMGYGAWGLCPKHAQERKWSEESQLKKAEEKRKAEDPIYQKKLREMRKEREDNLRDLRKKANARTDRSGPLVFIDGERNVWSWEK